MAPCPLPHVSCRHRGLYFNAISQVLGRSWLCGLLPWLVLGAPDKGSQSSAACTSLGSQNRQDEAFGVVDFFCEFRKAIKQHSF